MLQKPFVLLTLKNDRFLCHPVLLSFFLFPKFPISVAVFSLLFYFDFWFEVFFFFSARHSSFEAAMVSSRSFTDLRCWKTIIAQFWKKCCSHKLPCFIDSSKMFYLLIFTYDSTISQITIKSFTRTWCSKPPFLINICGDPPAKMTKSISTCYAEL